MSETDFLKLKKHDNVETNTEKFDIENYLNGNWDKINENAKRVNTDISNINLNSTELEKELKEAQEDIYQNSIRGQASGEYIHVEDSSNCRAKIGIGGNDEQETREGYNFLPNTVNTVTISGISFTVNKDKTVLVNGTATENAVLMLNSGVTYSAGTYKLSGCPQGGASDTYRLDLMKTSDNTIPVIELGNGASFSITEETTFIPRIRVQKGTTINNLLFKPMLVTDTSKTKYEQYGASPSPDYQSPVKTVGSNVNLFDITKYDYRNLAGANIQINNKTDFRVNATMNNNANCAIGFKIMDLTKYAGKILTVKSYVKSSTSTNKAFLVLRQNNSDYTGTKTNELFDESQNTTNGVITLKYKVTDIINDSNRYLFIWFYANRETTCNIGDYIDYKVKLVAGTEVGEYSNNGQGCVKVTKCNKNLINIEEIEWGTYYIATGALGTSFNWGTIKVKALGNTKYYLSGNKVSNNAACVVLLDKNKEFIKLVDGYTNTHLITTTNDTCYIGISIPKYIDGNADDTTTIMLEEKETLTAYKEHQEQSYIMPTQQEMLKGDYFDWDNEEEVHTWNKLVLNGTEEFKSWTGNAPSGYSVFYSKILTTVVNPQGDLKCNALKYMENPWESGKNAIGLQKKFKELYISIESKYASTLEEFKTYLKSQYDAGTPVVVYYKLATPTRLAFTEEQKAVAKELNNARTYKNVTNITTDSKAILDLDYAKDLETLLNNTQALAVNNASEGV